MQRWGESVFRWEGGWKTRNRELFDGVLAGDGSGLLEEESFLPGTEDYQTTPCGMLEAARAWEGWALNQFRQQSHLLVSLSITVSSFTNQHSHTLHQPPQYWLPFIPILWNVSGKVSFANLIKQTFFKLNFFPPADHPSLILQIYFKQII